MRKYFTIQQKGVAEYKIMESKFLAYAYPVKSAAEFKEILGTVKKLHPKANHHCFGYRIGVDGDVSRSSDDREPSGTAGRPILNQIIAKDMTDTLIVVVRYFGGILLGIPRLTNAYKTAASLVLQCTPIVERHLLVPISVECHYPELHDVLHILRQSQAEINHQELQLFCHIHASVQLEKADVVIDQLQQLKNVIATQN